MIPAAEFSTLCDMEICVAIDVSGSTVGAPLAAEIEVVTKFLDLRDETNKTCPKVTLLPWTVTPHHLIPLPEPVDKLLEMLDPDSGTAPSCLFFSPEYVAALQKCNLWFFLTDGAVDEEELKAFTRAAMGKGIHGKACIVIFFGYENDYCHPGDLDVSAGISVFSLATDALYLFRDIPTGQIYILQAKGAFSSLLASRSQPIFTDALRWDMLPTTTYASVGAVRFPPIEKTQALLSKDQIALEHNLVITPKHLYEDRIPRAILDRIPISPALLDRILTPTHLRTISIISLSLGSADALARWLATQFKLPPNLPLQSSRPDINNQAQASLARILQYLHANIHDRRLTDAQCALRKAQEANWSRHRLNVIEYYHAHTTPINHHNALLYRALLDLASLQTAMTTHPPPNHRRNFFPARIAFPSQLPPTDHESFRAELVTSWIPGFLLTPYRNFFGTCGLCARPKSQMALLFKAVDATTLGLGIQLQIQLPLEHGIRELISSTVCCDLCAYQISTPPPSPSQKTLGRVIAAIPCVGFAGRDETSARNAAAVVRALEGVLGGRVATEDVKRVWIEVVGNSGFAGMDGELEMFGRALSWFYSELTDAVALERLRDRVRIGALRIAALSDSDV